MITLKTLPNATAQEVFDQVATHLLKQKHRSLTNDAFCAYRGDGGMMCAAGCLIGPKEYTKKFEGHNWGEMISHHKVDSSHKLLICKLQMVHDNATPATWPDHLKILAKEFGLNTEVLKKAKTKSV